MDHHVNDEQNGCHTYNEYVSYGHEFIKIKEE